MKKKSVAKEMLEDFRYKPSGSVAKDMIGGLKPKLPKVKLPKKLL